MRVKVILVAVVAAVAAAVGSAIRVTPTDCDACMTVVEEYYQRWVEAAHEHYKAKDSLKQSDKGGEPRTWWDPAESMLDGAGLKRSFSDRLKETCNTERLALYDASVKDMCDRLLLDAGHNGKLAQLYGGEPEGEDKYNVVPGKRVGIWRVPGMKWHVCHNAEGLCEEGRHFKSANVLTDRCGMCRMLANDLLYLIRRGDKGDDPTAFYEAVVLDLCLSVGLRHPRGQHSRLTAICHSILDTHEDALRELVKRHVEQGELDAFPDDEHFQHDMCGEEVAGLC